MLMLYALDPDPTFGAALAGHLGVAIAPHEDRGFEDGEHKLRPLSDPRGSDAYVVLSLHGGLDKCAGEGPSKGPGHAASTSPHDKLFLLLMFMATLREHGAARVTAVIPYLAYARKDRQTKPFDPVTLRYVAQWLEASGAAQVMVLDAHNVAAFQNAFRCPTLHIEAQRAFEPLAQALAATPAGQQGLCVASPDPGGVKRAQLWRESLEQTLGRNVGFALVDKRRSAGMVSSEHLVAGDVQGCVVLLQDDLIASGGTLQRAARALRQAGAAQIHAFAAHGLFTGSAAETLADDALAAIAVTDSVPPFRLAANAAVRSKLQIASVVPAFAQAIAESHGTWLRH